MYVLAAWFSRERREIKAGRGGVPYRRRADSGGGIKEWRRRRGGWRQAKRDGEEVAVAGFEGQVQNEMERGKGRKEGGKGDTVG